MANETLNGKCNCDYYILTEQDQQDIGRNISVDNPDKALAIFEGGRRYDTPTNHKLGCPIDVLTVCPNPGDFYTNIDVYSARTGVIYRSKGLLEEGPVLEDQLSQLQKDQISSGELVGNARQIGLYRK